MKALLRKIRQHYGKLLLFSAIAIFYINYGCPIRFFTGISCPGCGMTRALSALLKLDFALAFEMHPLVFLLPPAVLVYLLRRLIPKKALRLIYTCGFILLIGVYILRISQGSAVAYIDPASGFIFKLFNT